MTGNIGLPVIPEGTGQSRADQIHNPFTSILPLLMSLPTSAEPKDRHVTKPSRYLLAKGLPTLPMKTVEKQWNLEYVDMEEFLPTPRSLWLADAVQANRVSPGEPCGGLQPIPGLPAAEGASSSAGHNDLGEMLFPLHCSDGKESAGDDPMYGSTLAHSATAESKSRLQVSMAGV